MDYFPRSDVDDDDEEYSFTALEEYEDTQMSVNDDLVPECPPPETDDEEDVVEITSGISATIGIASDFRGALSPSDLQEFCGEVSSKGGVTGSYGATAIPEDKTKPIKNRHLKSGGAFCMNLAVIRIPLLAGLDLKLECQSFNCAVSRLIFLMLLPLNNFMSKYNAYLDVPFTVRQSVDRGLSGNDRLARSIRGCVKSSVDNKRIQKRRSFHLFGLQTLFWIRGVMRFLSCRGIGMV